MARAINSFTVPVSPRINTVASVGATTSTCPMTRFMAVLLPIISSKLSLFSTTCSSIFSIRSRSRRSCTKVIHRKPADSRRVHQHLELYRDEQPVEYERLFDPDQGLDREDDRRFRIHQHGIRGRPRAARHAGGPVSVLADMPLGGATCLPENPAS